VNCDICEFSTKSQKDLENHKAEKHTGNQSTNEGQTMIIDGEQKGVLKPNLLIACNICKKAFVTEKELESHSQM
jgi:hypothetical protein